MGRPLKKQQFFGNTGLAGRQIQVSAWVPGDSQARTGYIVKQEGTRRYKVTTSGGTGYCNLKATAVAAAGEMTITATDSASGAYFVTKLTRHKATLAQNGGTQFATGQAIHWVIYPDTATLGQSVLIATA